jgi:transcriptional regulator with XRE-family HTH domain
MKSLRQKIAGKIKELRKAKGLNQQTLALRTGLATSYISLLEGGKKMAAISTLSRLADALGVRVGEFFEDNSSFLSPRIVITRGNQASPPPEENGFGYTYIPLSREKKGRTMDPFLIRLEPDNVQKHAFVHKGEEFNYIVQGTLKVTYENEEFILETGDSAYFDSSVPHKLEVVGKKPVYVLSVQTAFSEDSEGVE